VSDFAAVHRRTVSLVGRVHKRATAAASASLSRWERRCVSETLISDLWQFWNEFVREVLISSCAGSVTRSGAAIVARTGDNSWERVSYEAVQYVIASKSHKPPKVKKTKKNVARYQDPTWGDLDTIIDVVNGLAPTNAPALATGFGATAIGMKHLQVTRNACFHKNSETRQSVKNIERLYFASADLGDVADLAWKPYFGKTTPAILDWISSFMAVSEIVTK